VPVKKVETPKGNYILYMRKNNADFDLLKSILANLTKNISSQNEKDIIVDYGTTSSIFAHEIGVFVSMAKVLADQQRKLVLLLSKECIRQIESTNIQRTKNIVVVENQITHGAAPTDEDGTIVSAPAKDDLRLVECPSCNYQVWTTDMMLELGMPTCPFGHAMVAQ
jgi:hypothetical protein